MSHESDLDELSILKHGYERFLSSPGDLGNCENAIITVRRAQQITTHFGPLTTKNKIKVSLSQEQILNQANRYPSNMKRSQSTNTQKNLVSSNGIVRINRINSIRPSQIPIKIKEQTKLRALTLSPNQRSPDSSSPKYRSLRKMSAPIEKRNYVSQQESTLSSLPLPMTQSFDRTSQFQNDFDDNRIDLLEKFKCGICLNILKDSRVLNCLHTFCMECLYNIDSSKINSNKLNPNLRSNSFENKEMTSSNCSVESKESDRKSIASSMSNKPIRKALMTTPKKRTNEVKVSQSVAIFNH